ncbi:MAG TPA: M23 family metallopeptidase [Gaiellaceae bacterium]|nr:M23 family metallopeptidase [Gaiellaceae bacterium]
MGSGLRLAAVCAVALVLAAPAGAHPLDGGKQLSFAWPAAGEVTRGFGFDPATGEEHAGLDIGSLRSLEVRAAAPGVVEQVGYAPGFDGYGLIVLVDVGFGFETLYAHLARVDVRPGQTVAPDEPLGEAGSTGFSTGVHLHFELREDGAATDATPLLPAGRPGFPEAG